MADDIAHALELLCASLRKSGVSEYEGPVHEGGLHCRLKLLPMEPKSEKKKPDTKDAICKCGHPVWSHQGGLCIDGCDIEKCAPEEK